ncbi:MAG TPA: ATP-dependent DNA ligase [Candidatus Woesearchaeota archaeon]|nr:ATP-dependent DNA ligase [Candidatus Woesearchaeota archaeon]
MEFKRFAEICEELEKTSQRIEKSYIISQFFESTDPKDASVSSLLFLGDLYPGLSEEKIGLSSQLVIKAISKSYGITQQQIENKWKNTGDLGIVAKEYNENKKQSTLFSKNLSIQYVFDTLKSIALQKGKGSVDSKLALLSSLLTSANPIEAKFIARSTIGDLRIGAGEGVIRDAIQFAYLPKIALGEIKAGAVLFCPSCKSLIPYYEPCPSCKESIKKAEFQELKDTNYKILTLSFKEFQSKTNTLDKNTIIISKDSKQINDFIKDTLNYAINIITDLSAVILVSSKEGLNGLINAQIKLFRPTRAMLFIKAKTIKEAQDALGTKVCAEYKYDGFRVQIHKQDENVMLFTRTLENVTKQFPDVTTIIKEKIKAKSIILDSEVVGIDPISKKYKAFQEVSQRIRRKYDIKEIASKVPVEVNIFDVLYFEGKSVMDLPFSKRRDIIENIVPIIQGKIRPSIAKITANLLELESFYNQSLNAGNEGIMLKALDKPYVIGRKVGFGMKIKPVMETLDLVIVGAEWGEGKRTGLLTSYIVACKGEDDELLEIGKVSTGLKEQEGDDANFIEITNQLKKLITQDLGKNVKVKPRLVIETNFEEIQKSNSYSSGFALRFPRVIRVREDKDLLEVSELSLIKELYLSQRGRETKPNPN